jgi:hypothetical protein
MQSSAVQSSGNQSSGDTAHRVRRGAVVIGWLLAGLFLIAAEIGSVDLVGNVQNPMQACEKALPWTKGLVATSAERSWHPPLVRCEATDADTPGTGAVTRVSAVTTKNVVVVALLDAVTILILARLALNAFSARRTRRRESQLSDAR